MGTPLKTPPVYFTVVQVRFNAVLKLAEYLPTIQDDLRKCGFPDFESRQEMVLRINVQDGQQVPVPASNERYFFGSADKKHRFVLSSDFLALMSSDYGTFESFSSKFLEGLAMVNSAVKLDYTERVGLRYLDHVSPRENEDLSMYLVQEAQGLSARLGGASVHSFTETLTAFGKVKLTSRVLIQSAGLIFPPDLQPDGMNITQRFLDYQGTSATLDADSFVEGREMFSLDHVKQLLDDTHAVVRKAFRDTVTDHAFKVWGGE
jgi:uncharacterized protein (TIGR04255 family)